MLSFEEITDKLRMALRAEYSTTDNGPWVMQTYPYKVIYELEGKFYSAPFMLDGDDVIFGERREVEREVEWEEKAGRRHSGGDMKMLQTMHDYAVNLGASCGEKKSTISAAITDAPNGTTITIAPDTYTEAGNALKAISETDDEYRVGNYIVLFNGRDLEGIASPRKNADGSIGEYFTKSTDLESSYTQTGLLYVDWEHGNDSLTPDDVLGRVDWETKAIDERGVWVERVLNRRNKYVQWLKSLIDAGMVGNSVEAISNKVQKGSDGQIVRYPLRRDTLTVTPMEPRMLSENTLAALKALADEVPCIKSACLKSGLLTACKEAEVLEIKAKLANIKSKLED